MTDPTAACPNADTLTDLALGELTGRARSDALAHVAGCRTCREQVQQLVETADLVLLAAPVAEPPAGFESAVLGRLTQPAVLPRRRSARRWRTVAIAAAVALVMAVSVFIGVRLTRDSASEFAETAMITPSGRDVGRAWRYHADPSWILVSVPRWRVWEQPGATPLRYRLRATLDDGSTVDLGALRFADRSGAWGTTTSIAADRIRAVAVTDTTGHVWCEGRFSTD